MSIYMGRSETADAVAKALELLRNYPHRLFSYNPNDPLANSVVTYLKKQGKIVVKRFHQFQAAPKHKTNPAPGPAERSERIHKIRKPLVVTLKKAIRDGNIKKEWETRQKIRKLDYFMYSPRKIKRRK
jgi:hypothetical protein